jgi:DNA-binding response OmpR family regulator
MLVYILGGNVLARERILIIEDDPDIREIIKLRLVKEGFEVAIAEDDEKGLAMVPVYKPDLIILDILLPNLDGYDVCREIRKNYQTPIIFLSCKDEDDDKIIGLTVGGNDYMTKPFSMGEFLARVRVQLRRKPQDNQTIAEPKTSLKNETKIIFPDLEIDLNSHTVLVKGEEIELTNKEFQILTMLAQNPNSVFSTGHIFNKIWGYDSYGDDRTIMVHISNLRKKIEKDPFQSDFIQTIKGVGYKFTPKRKL